jgi:hypothetical protein
LIWLSCACFGPAAAQQQVELARLDAVRTDAGVLLDFDVRFELPRAVEDALRKGVPLYFEAEARLLRSRWYWRDKRVAGVSRSWRIAYQPLTSTYRLGLAGLNQSFTSLPEMLRVVQRGVQWRIAEPIPADDDGRYYVEFSYRLDTTQLPRPMQIGIGSQPEWDLQIERTIQVAPPQR